MVIVGAYVESGDFQIDDDTIIYSSQNMQISVTVDFVGRLDTIKNIAIAAIESVCKTGESASIIGCGLNFEQLFNLLDSDLSRLFPARCTLVKTGRLSHMRLKKEWLADTSHDALKEITKIHSKSPLGIILWQLSNTFLTSSPPYLQLIPVMPKLSMSLADLPLLSPQPTLTILCWLNEIMALQVLHFVGKINKTLRISNGPTRIGQLLEKYKSQLKQLDQLISESPKTMNRLSLDNMELGELFQDTRTNFRDDLRSV
ncbi:unnamed protein product [Blepharisma stoltei]|uniref:MutS-like protein n=1 Tax=Blepharisma stoltei TaxID=1481888 RepID=A0AAU9JNT6_9CILI|nr:unnamed protein product [Blepharisma stoltei]